MPNIISINKELLTTLYHKESFSVKKIAQKLGYSETCIYNNLLRHGIQIITNHQRYAGKPGRQHSEAAKRKMAISKMGDKNPTKRLEVRIKLSKAKIGKKLSQETREKMSVAQKGRLIKWGRQDI